MKAMLSKYYPTALIIIMIVGFITLIIHAENTRLDALEQQEETVTDSFQEIWDDVAVNEDLTVSEQDSMLTVVDTEASASRAKRAEIFKAEVYYRLKELR